MFKWIWKDIDTKLCRWDELERLLFTLSKQEITSFLQANDRYSLSTFAITCCSFVDPYTHPADDDNELIRVNDADREFDIETDGSSETLGGRFGVYLHFDTRRNMMQNMKSYRRSVKDRTDLIEIAQWNVRHYRHININATNSGSGHAQWEDLQSMLAPLRKVLMEYERDRWGPTPDKPGIFEEWLSDSACRVLFRLKQEGVLWEAGPGRQGFCGLVKDIGHDRTPRDSADRLRRVLKGPW